MTDDYSRIRLFAHRSSGTNGRLNGEAHPTMKNGPSEKTWRERETIKNESIDVTNSITNNMMCFFFVLSNAKCYYSTEIMATTMNGKHLVMFLWQFAWSNNLISPNQPPPPAPSTGTIISSCSICLQNSIVYLSTIFLAIVPFTSPWPHLLLHSICNGCNKSEYMFLHFVAWQLANIVKWT